MATFRMAHFPQANAEVHTILGGQTLSQLCLSVPGDYSFVCSLCSKIVCSNINPYQLRGFCYLCGSCGAINILPKEASLPGGWGPPPPEPISGTIVDSTPAHVGRKLIAAMRWLTKIGINADRTRFGEYLRAARHAGGSSSRGPGKHTYDAIQRECFDLLTIHDVFGNGDYDRFINDRLHKLCSGPILISDESSEASREARNFAFELLVLSWIRGAGLALDFTSLADAGTNVDGRTVFFEAKRPGKGSACAKRIKEAHAQLVKRCELIPNGNARGVIALDLSRLFPLRHELSVSKTPQELAADVDAFVLEFAQEHRKVVTSMVGTSTIGVLMRVCTLYRGPGSPRNTVVNRVHLHSLPGINLRDDQTVKQLGISMRRHLVRNVGKPELLAIENPQGRITPVSRE